MLTEEQIVELLKDRNLKAVARSANVSYFTLHRWLRGHNQTPSHRMIKNLSEYLEQSIVTALGGKDE